MAYEEGRGTVDVVAKKRVIRDPRKDPSVNASPKRMARNLISGTWVFDSDTTGAVDIVLPEELVANTVAAKASWTFNT